MLENKNASCAYASFRLIGKDLNPDEVTGRLGIVPSQAFRRGDQRGKTNIWPHGHWGITSKDKVLSTDLALHIEWLLDQLDPVQSQVKEFVGDESIRADIFCFWMSRTGHGGPSFSPQLLRRIADFDLELGLDIYFDFEEDAAHWALSPESENRP